VTTLLVSSAGGHLAELHRLVPRLRGVADDHVWVTFDTPQSRSLLDGVEVVYVRHTYPRDLANVVRNTVAARRLLGRNTRFSAVVSTGSGIALSFLPLARTRRLPCFYIESGGRIDGPSVTGRLLERMPGIGLYTQYRSWSRERWRYGGSILDAFAAENGGGPAPEVRRVLVTLGTTPYGFRRLVERTLEIVPPDVEILWQIGPTDVEGLPVEPRRIVPVHELEEDIRSVDAVIAHAGFATAVTALELGRCPVLVPRREGQGENVDEHQLEIARELAARNLAVNRVIEELTWDDVLRAARKRVSVLSDPPPIDLT
jgi:UDP-N-acetylglucosamine--N-acetylmuramyl-(pentapeptide) pyrophosphoryl-undecaprenol N-acetylglucosamine transferase